jgi:hypothetical protein
MRPLTIVLALVGFSGMLCEVRSAQAANLSARCELTLEHNPLYYVKRKIPKNPKSSVKKTIELSNSSEKLNLERYVAAIESLPEGSGEGAPRVRMDVYDRYVPQVKALTEGSLGQPLEVTLTSIDDWVTLKCQQN